MGCGGGVSGSRYADIVCIFFYRKSNYFTIYKHKNIMDLIT